MPTPAPWTPTAGVWAALDPRGAEFHEPPNKGCSPGFSLLRSFLSCGLDKSISEVVLVDTCGCSGCDTQGTDRLSRDDRKIFCCDMLWPIWAPLGIMSAKVFEKDVKLIELLELLKVCGEMIFMWANWNGILLQNWRHVLTSSRIWIFEKQLNGFGMQRDSCKTSWIIKNRWIVQAGFVQFYL